MGTQRTKIVLADEKLSIHLSRVNLVQLPKPSNLLSALDLLQNVLNQHMQSINSKIVEQECENQKHHQKQMNEVSL